MKKKHIIRIITLTGLILFTTITLFLSTSILLDILGIREQQGHYVPLVIWSNFLCGCLYILSIIGLFTHKKWSIVPMVLALFILVGAFLAYTSISWTEVYMRTKPLWPCSLESP